MWSSRWVCLSVLKKQRVVWLGEDGKRLLCEDSFFHSVTKINNGTFGLEVHIILVTHRSPAAQAHWETNAFLLEENEAQSSFSQSLFWSSAEDYCVFPWLPCVLSWFLPYLVWDSVTEKKNGHIKLICRSWVPGSTVFLVDNHSRRIPFFQRKEGCVLPHQIPLSLLAKYIFLRKENDLRFMESQNLHLFFYEIKPHRFLYVYCKIMLIWSF